MKTTLVLRRSNQVTIPKHICEVLGLEKDDVIEIELKKIAKQESENETA
ncbi:MAG: AbrB/MazE/SpoVT family DNA-binding domain-containing protein [Candidatus Heimdallarchaeota archaeon]|nr:AbrB/MazE/SpoVT family DNA-binding domain-containing protein [Candidatus Heimdallarchaeota archaeon]MCK4612751.1 AbrB/MazE/SpoVT family DNA-binding domain-containing protein [Candidatus Heimdallarchaeota archaeon]